MLFGSDNVIPAKFVAFVTVILGLLEWVEAPYNVRAGAFISFQTLGA